MLSIVTARWNIRVWTVVLLVLAAIGTMAAKSAVFNGLLAPFVLVGILLVACDSVLMQNQRSSMLARITFGITTIGMFAAGIAIFLV
jgi:Mn2+/Fe2+ NRAMP family transporter